MLGEIETWTKNFNKSPVFWLNGLAGTGKSTIAQTIAEHVFAEDSLGASFFCSRDFEDRSNLHFIFPTLAFQLAHKYPDFRSHFVPLLRSNPDVAHESLYRQMQKLIAEPLRTTCISTVIVIDALDECKDDEPSSAILSVLGRFVGQIPKVKFFITGRPEPRIKTGFRLPLLVHSTDVFVLHDVHSSLIDSDIRLFLKHELSELARQRRLEQWPSDDHVDLLCQRAGGFFAYAVATVKFLGSSIHLPKNQLRVILKLPESTVPEGKTWLNQNITLDSLYTSILEAAIVDGDPEVDSRVRTTIGTIVSVVNPLPPLAIAELMGLDPEEVTLFLTLVQSLLAVDEDPNKPVKPFHKSFPDFITDPSRCANPRFCISPGDLHSEIVTNCLRVMNDGLDPNLLSLTEYALNSEVKDIQARIDNRVGIALQYACRSWHNHLTETKRYIPTVTCYLRIFLEENFLAWLEVLSVLGDVGGAAVGLEKLMTWLQEVCLCAPYHFIRCSYSINQVSKDNQLLSTARDCFHFVTKFFEPISVSAAHIYHSALELCPMSSIVRRLYYHRGRPITPWPRVMIGAPDSWDHVVSISNKDHKYRFCIWSPCGRFIAAQTTKAVEIRDQLTFELLTTLQPTEPVRPLAGPLTYSPDGHSLACVSYTSIVIWDIQTGGVAEEIRCGFKNISMAWSLDQRTIGFIDSEKRVRTHDLVSGTTMSPGEFSSISHPYFWAHERSFRILRTVPSGRYDEAIVEVLEVGHTLTKIYSFSFMRNIMPQFTFNISYSPTACRIAISAHHSLHIFEDRKSIFCPSESENISFHCFSSDGSLFAAAAGERIRVWKYISRLYMQWKELRCPGHTSSFLQFSPTQLSILGSFGGILQGWRLHDPPNTPETDHRQYAGLSRSGNYIATAYRLEMTITVTNLHSQAPSQLIDTDLKIEGLALSGSILLVFGSETVVAWLLTEEGLVRGVLGGRRAGRSNSVWATSLSHFTPRPVFKVEGYLGTIAPNGEDSSRYIIYHTETGEIFQPDQVHRRLNSPWKRLDELSAGRDYFGFHNLTQHDAPPERGWQTSKVTVGEGWVKDSEGRHRLWVPVEWRADWDLMDWCHNIVTQFSILGGQTVIIKF